MPGVGPAQPWGAACHHSAQSQADSHSRRFDVMRGDGRRLTGFQVVAGLALSEQQGHRIHVLAKMHPQFADWGRNMKPCSVSLCPRVIYTCQMHQRSGLKNKNENKLWCKLEACKMRALVSYLRRLRRASAKARRWALLVEHACQCRHCVRTDDAHAHVMLQCGETWWWSLCGAWCWWIWV